MSSLAKFFFCKVYLVIIKEREERRLKKGNLDIEERNKKKFNKLK